MSNMSRPNAWAKLNLDRRAIQRQRIDNLAEALSCTDGTLAEVATSIGMPHGTATRLMATIKAELGWQAC